MDYGAMLKKEVVNPNRRSLHYKRQESFEGSHRQLRGLVLKSILQSPGVTESALTKQIEKEPEKIKDALIQVKKEGFIREERQRYSIA